MHRYWLFSPKPIPKIHRFFSIELNSITYKCNIRSHNDRKIAYLLTDAENRYKFFHVHTDGKAYERDPRPR